MISRPGRWSQHRKVMTLVKTTAIFVRSRHCILLIFSREFILQKISILQAIFGIFKYCVQNCQLMKVNTMHWGIASVFCFTHFPLSDIFSPIKVDLYMENGKHYLNSPTFSEFHINIKVPLYLF